MKKFIVAVLALLALQMIASPTPEEMYGSLDKDGKYRQMHAQVGLPYAQRRDHRPPNQESRRAGSHVFCVLKSYHYEKTFFDNAYGTDGIGLSCAVPRQ